MLGGLIAFRQTFRGQYWLEVFVLSACTAFDEELDALRRCIELIEPDRVQLNTATRPPAEPYAIGLASKRMARIAKRLHPRAEVIAEYRTDPLPPESFAGRDEVFNLLRRRPCTISDIADGLRMHRSEVLKCVDYLVLRGVVETIRVGRTVYCRAVNHSRASASWSI